MTLSQLFYYYFASQYSFKNTSIYFIVCFKSKTYFMIILEYIVLYQDSLGQDTNVRMCIYMYIYKLFYYKTLNCNLN